jgi:hypothetical protein
MFNELSLNDIFQLMKKEPETLYFTNVVSVYR